MHQREKNNQALVLPVGHAAFCERSASPSALSAVPVASHSIDRLFRNPYARAFGQDRDYKT